jgi:hypothetical protein
MARFLDILEGMGAQKVGESLSPTGDVDNFVFRVRGSPLGVICRECVPTELIAPEWLLEEIAMRLNG